MAKREDWPTIRAELESRGYDLNVGGLLHPSSVEKDDFWTGWDRLAPSLGAEGGTSLLDTTWETVEPVLDEIEALLGGGPPIESERTMLDHPLGVQALKRAVRGLSNGAVRAFTNEDERSALHLLGLAAEASMQVGGAPTLLGALVRVSNLLVVFRAAGRLLEVGLDSGGNESLRGVVAPLGLPPWRGVVHGEIRFNTGWIDRMVSDEPDVRREVEEEIRQSKDVLRLARVARAPGQAQRIKVRLGHRYARALLAPVGRDEDADLATFGHLAAHLETSPLCRFSPDPVVRADTFDLRRVWPQLPGLYEGIARTRRMLLLASRAADLPSGAPFAEVLRLRESLGAEGREPLSGRPLEVRDEGAHWTFRAAAGGHVASVRLPRP